MPECAPLRPGSSIARLPRAAGGLLGGLVLLAVGPADAEFFSLLPEIGEIDDPWDAWDTGVVPPAVAIPEPAFDPPPAAELLPPRARPAPRFRFREIQFEGNREVSADTLRGLVGWILERPVDAEDLDHARDEITRHYLAGGHINSGAIAAGPDEEDEGILLIRVIEGRLSRLDLRQRSDLRRNYLQRRLGVGRDEILHFPTLQRRLQSLQLNPNVERVTAGLRPGSEPGTGIIELSLDPSRRWFYGLDFHNQLPPSVGAEQLDAWFSTPNLSGLADLFELRYGVFAGGALEADLAPGDQVRLHYGIPVFDGDTVLSARFDRQGYAVIEEPFAELAINGETSLHELRITRALIHSAGREVKLHAALGRTSSWTELLGSRFTISPGYLDGELDLTVAALGADWVNRRADEVWRAETSLRFGLDWFGVTASGLSEFVAWNGSLQYLRRMNEAGHVLSLRGAWQLADGPLPATEQSTLGGIGTVRGYRQNSLVRDESVNASVEWRIPAPDWHGWATEWVAFADYGIGRDAGGGSSDSRASLGVGVVFRRADWLRGEVFWGYALDRDAASGNDLQDDGLHFRVSLGRF